MSKSNAPKLSKSEIANLRKLDAAVAACVSAVAKADAGKGSAMIATIRATAMGGTATAEMLAKSWPTLSESSRGVTVSNFNLGGKAAAIIGIPATLKLIQDVEAANPSRRYDAVLDALRAVKAQAKGVDVATSEQVVTFIAGAAKAASDGTAAKKAKKAAAKKGAKSPTAKSPTASVDLTKGMQPVIGVKSASLQLQVWCAAAAKVEDPKVRAIVGKVAKLSAELAKLAG